MDEIASQLFDIKEKLTDGEYINLMNSLKKAYPSRKPSSNDSVLNTRGDLFTIPERQESDHNSELTKLEVTMFVSTSCHWCKKAIDMLIEKGEINNLKILDIQTDEGLQQAILYGEDIKPIPNFVSLKNQTSTIGYKPLESLLDELNR